LVIYDTSINSHHPAYVKLQRDSACGIPNT